MVHTKRDKTYKCSFTTIRVESGNEAIYIPLRQGPGDETLAVGHVLFMLSDYILFPAGETLLVGSLVYKTYAVNFLTELGPEAVENVSHYCYYYINDTSAVDSNDTMNPEFVKRAAKPTYEQILPDYLQVCPEEWNMKDF